MKYTIPIDCKNANGNVNHLVYCWIFCVHCCHCSCSSSRWGTTACNSCIIIDALMYGINHTAIIEKLSSVHQRSIAKYSSQLPDCIVLAISCHTSTNGTGINTRNLYTTRIAIVYKSFFLIDLLVNISLMYLMNCSMIAS